MDRYSKCRNLKFRVPKGYFALFKTGDVVSFDDLEQDIYASLQDLRCYNEWLDKRVGTWEVVHETEDFVYIKKEA